MNLIHLQIFSTILETGSFTKAGEKLGITQSGVTHAVASLEQELGVSLLFRERGKVTLTESGERVLRHVKEIQYHVDSIRDESLALSTLESGKIRIGSFPSASSRLLPKMLAAFQRKYPKIEVVLFEGRDQEILGWMEQRIIDIGFTTLPQNELDTIAISEDRMMVVTALQHRLAKQEYIQLDDTVHEPFILSKGVCGPIIEKLYQQQKIPLSAAFEVNDMTTIFSMVQEVMGWTIVPEEALPETRSSICAIPLNPITWRRIGLAMKSKKQCNHATLVFIKVAE